MALKFGMRGDVIMGALATAEAEVVAAVVTEMLSVDPAASVAALVAVTASVVTILTADAAMGMAMAMEMVMAATLSRCRTGGYIGVPHDRRSRFIRRGSLSARMQTFTRSLL